MPTRCHQHLQKLSQKLLLLFSNERLEHLFFTTSHIGPLSEFAINLGIPMQHCLPGTEYTGSEVEERSMKQETKSSVTRD